MTVHLHYIESANSMRATLIVTDPNDPTKNDEFELPKFIIDLVRTAIQNGTMDLTTLWARALDVQKDL